MAKIENHKYTIEEAFRECFYIVPDYQREYVWTEKEVQQLLDDINEQIDGGVTREYFIGTVLVSPTSQKNHYEVIDGQQRLTTLFLLLCALRHLFRGESQCQVISSLISTSYTTSAGETQTSLKLEPRYENAGEVMEKLVALDADPQATRSGIQAAGIASFGSLENLVNAYGTLFRHLKDNYDDKPKLRKYWGYARIRGVGAFVSTYGVGELSAINGVAGAFAERVPVVVITGAPATACFQTRPQLHHTLDDYQIPFRMYEAVTVAAARLVSAATAPAEIDRVLAACLAAQRPVYLSLPADASGRQGQETRAHTV